MTDFEAARRMMVDGQVRTADVTDLRVITAMLEVPRERFVPAESAGLAYVDLDLPVGAGKGGARKLLKPMVLGKLIQAAELKATDRVLDAGCATGYSSAILAQIAGEVVALEQDSDLARRATESLRGAGNVQVVAGDLKAGWPPGAPYDAILLGGATEVDPDALLGQLADGGRLLCVLGGGPGAKATLYRKSDDGIGVRPIFDARAAVLPGFSKQPAFAF
ncbi:MAG TPA: protein-L-isoaspartate O-methyltransferase [Pseudolabrys sp.]|nr:protein-L-isoaspartate O-methyltransferase [Pseudolabrys sp.]